MIRNFTNVGDIVESIKRLAVKLVCVNENWNSDAPHSNSSSAPYRIFNIGNYHPVQVLAYIEALEKALGKTAIKKMITFNPGMFPQLIIILRLCKHTLILSRRQVWKL